VLAPAAACTRSPAAVAKAVKAAGGQLVEQALVKPWELTRWVREQGARLGLSLDAAAAKALVAQVGERQQRLLRELEKLALGADLVEGGGDPTERPGGAAADAGGSAGAAATVITAEQIEAAAAHSVQSRAYSLADALLAADPREAALCYVRLREQGERLPGLLYLMSQRLREALSVSLRLAAGESAAEVKRGLRMPARAAERFVAHVARTDPERLRRALGVLADLELDSRGGAPLSSSRSALAGLEEDTLALRAIEAITA